MNKLVHYILIAIMFNWNIAVFAEEENKGCKWEVVEETETYIQESCVGGEDGRFQARIRSKPVDGSIVIVEAPKKNKKKEEKKEEEKIILPEVVRSNARFVFLRFAEFGFL